MGKGRENVQYIVAGCVCCVLLITSIILIAVSVSVLEPNEVGIEYNTVQEEINTEKAFESGRHFLGVGHHFIIYPKTLQTVKFSNTPPADAPAIDVRTTDGLVVSIDVSFNFKLIATVGELSELYLNFGEMPEVVTAYNRIARNWVRVVASRYTAFEFFFNRTQIQEDMQATLNDELIKAHGTVESLQLLNLNMPAAFDDARTRQETAVQEIEQRQSERTVANIQAETLIRRVAKEAEVIVLNAEAQAESLKLEAAAQVEAVRAQFAAERESYQLLAKELNLTPTQLLSYIWLDAVKNGMDNSLVKLDMPTTIKNFA